jgi:mono/diheme cytochrome c family protein
MAEFENEHDLLMASRKVRDSGYTKTDAYTPYPVHGIDEALGIKPTILPFIVLTCGISGLCLAIFFQCWSNGIDYPYIISGKPMFSIPAFIPVTFETTVLFSAFSTFFFMWGLNKLPMFSSPLFANPRFDRVTNDRFFLHVDSRDKYYNKESVRELLAATQPLSLEEVIEDSTPNKLPAVIWMGVITLITASFIPLAVIANMRASNDDRPRWHVWFDMDFQPKKKAQQQSTLFADNRASRPQVAGTVARGQLIEQDPYYLGYDPSKQVSNDIPRAFRLVSTDGEPKTEPVGETPKAPKLEAPEGTKPAAEVKEVVSEEKPAAEKEDVPKAAEKKSETKNKSPSTNDGEAKVAEKSEEKKVEPKGDAATSPSKAPSPPITLPEADKSKSPGNGDIAKPTPTEKPAEPSASATPAAATGGPNLPWLTDFPTEVSEEMLALGKQRFEITCSVCHGYAGEGNGLVHRRAEQLQQSYWLMPTSLHDTKVQGQAVGNIFYTVSNGKGKMAGYGTVLTPKERWAIVMYVKALQRSRNASMQDVPVDERAKIEEVKKAE